MDFELVLLLPTINMFTPRRDHHRVDSSCTAVSIDKGNVKAAYSQQAANGTVPGRIHRQKNNSQRHLTAHIKTMRV